MDYRNILVLSAFLVNLFLSLLIYFRTKKTPANISLIIVAFSITGWCLGMFFYRAADLSTIVLWAKLLYFFPAFAPTAYLLFGLYFPNNKVSSRLLHAIIILTFIVTSLTLIDGAVIKNVIIIPGHEKKLVFGWAYYGVYIFYFPVLFSISYYIFYRRYVKASRYIKMQILYMLLGMTGASFPAMITNLNLPTFGYFELNWLGQVCTVFWIGGTAYAIIKHRLLDIRLVVTRAIVYLLLIIILGFLYALGVFGFASLFLHHLYNTDYFLASIGLALFISFTFQPLKSLLEQITDKIFFKGKYSSDDLVLTLTKIMASTINLEDLTKWTLRPLLDTIRISRGVFIIFKEKEDVRQTVIYEGYETAPKIDEELVRRLYDMKRVVIFDEEENQELKQQMRIFNIYVSLPLFEKDQSEGLLILGEKKSGDAYSEQDTDVLKIFGPEISVAIRNAKSYEEISKFNITLREEVEKATSDLKAANERLQSLDHLKDEFVSLASHELRTPMSAIKSYLWVLLQQKDEMGKLNDKQKQYLERTYSSTERLIKLVNDMLNVSRIESGRLQVTIKAYNLTVIVKEVMGDVMPSAQNQGINIKFEEPKDSLPLVLADSDKIKEVLINLIGNSLKFTPKGGIITVSFSQKDGYVITHVKDTGKGIKKEDMAKLFQKFGMIEGNYLSNTQMSTSGTGLGLYISKGIIQLLGGTITVESEGEDKGTTFSFSLKIADQPAQQVSEEQHPQ